MNNTNIQNAQLNPTNAIDVHFHLWDSKVFNKVDFGTASIAPDTPIVFSEYQKARLFQDGRGSIINLPNGTQYTKQLEDTNNISPGRVSQVENWIINEVNFQIEPTNNVNLWMHNALYWALSQGTLIFKFGDTEFFNIPCNRSYVGNSPYEYISRNSNDNLISWQDNEITKASRFNQWSNQAGYKLNLPVILTSLQNIEVNYEANKKALEHLQILVYEWYQKAVARGELLAPASNVLFFHDRFNLKVSMLGTKRMNYLKPM